MDKTTVDFTPNLISNKCTEISLYNLLIVYSAATNYAPDLLMQLYRVVKVYYIEISRVILAEKF